MREPLTWTKRFRLRRWALKAFSREHRAVVRTAADPAQRQQFTHHAARACALTRVFQISGDARDEVAFLVLERSIDVDRWNPAYRGMRAEIVDKLVSLGLPVRPEPVAEEQLSAR
jgi:hypothetical protein